MKLKSMPILISLLLFSPASGEEAKEASIIYSAPDAYTPSSACLFIEIAKIPKAVNLLNAKKEYFNISNLLFNYKTLTDNLRDKAGVDVLDPESLRKTGIDIDKPLYIASIENSEKAFESIFFIPITNKKNFPFAFVKILKKLTAHMPDLDLNPAISRYNDFNVYQIQPGIFFTIFDSYFILTPSGNSLAEIIDLKPKGCDSSLLTDPFYKDYKTNPEADKAGIINIFIKKEYINRAYYRSREKSGNENSNDKYIFGFDFINYISLSLKGEPDEISIAGTLSINKEDQLGNLLNETVATGMAGKAIFAENPIGYHLLSIDFDKLNNYCKAPEDKSNMICKFFAKLLKFFSERGIPLKETVLPCSKSFINVILKKSIIPGEMDRFLFFIPMKECGEIEDSVENMKDNLQDKYTDESFGKGKINGIEYFWFRNDSNKINVLEFDNNLYVGNDIDIIKDCLGSPGKNLFNVQRDFVKKIDKNTFLLSYTQFDDESFVKAVLMMIAFKKSPVMYSLISKTNSIYLIGKRLEYNLNFDLNIKMLPENK